MNIEKIGVDRFHKAGAVYSIAVISAQPMPGPLPATVFLTEELFDLIIFERVLGGLMMR
jgi:hypothetical protein